MLLTDSHAHLSYLAQRGQDLALTLGQWSASQGGLILDAGVEPGDLALRRAAIDAASKGLSGLNILCAAGAWPGKDSLTDPKASYAALLRDLDSEPRPVALGECGLDYHWMEADKGIQIEFFSALAREAKRRNLPLIVHSREANQDTLNVLRGIAPYEKIIIHCYSYDLSSLMDYLELGASISFAGNLCFPANSGLRQAAAAVPSDRLLAETDSPYMAPPPFRGTTCLPTMVEQTIACLARERGQEPEACAQIVACNAQRLFLDS